MPLISEKKDSLIRVCTCNHIFGRVIWDKFHECSFENFEIALVKRGQFQIFWKIYKDDLSPQLAKPNMWSLVYHTKPTDTLY